MSSQEQALKWYLKVSLAMVIHFNEAAQLPVHWHKWNLGWHGSIFRKDATLLPFKTSGSFMLFKARGFFFLVVTKVLWALPSLLDFQQRITRDNRYYECIWESNGGGVCFRRRGAVSARPQICFNVPSCALFVCLSVCVHPAFSECFHL